MTTLSPIQNGLIDINEGLRRHHLWLTLARDDVRVKYKRTFLGQFWITLGFGFFIAAISILWAEILGRDIAIFVPWFAAGITTWHFITGAINEGATTFTSASGTIHNIPLPLSVHIFRSITQQLINYGHNFVIVILVLLAFPPQSSAAMLLLLPGYAIILTAAIATKLILGVLGARYRDLSYGIRTIMTPMFFITPIMWLPDMLGSSRMWMAQLNPFAHFIAVIREPLLGRAPAALNYGVTITISLVLMFFGVRLLGKHRWKVPYWIA